MSKTTNYEISKKLEEIGFYSDYFEPDYLWVENKGEISCVKSSYFSDYMEESAKKLYKSYDLETLINALPDTIGGGLMIHKEGMYCQESMTKVAKLENESLADCAGKLLILLHEKNLIKF
jgi:hypothetical protein